MIEAICFDLDGTLVDYVGDFQELLIENASNLAIAPHLLEPFIKLTGHYTRSLANSLEIAKQSLRDLDIEPPQHLELLCQQLTERYAKHIELLDGADSLLNFLKQKAIPLAIITNGPTDMQLASIYKAGIQSYFKTILISGELGVRKPDARIFQLACERLEVAAENCLMIGDKLDADIQGAKSIGMQTAWMSQEKVQDVLSFSELQGLETWLASQLH